MLPKLRNSSIRATNRPLKRHVPSLCFLSNKRRHFSSEGDGTTGGKAVSMTNSEAFVESLVAHGVKDVFGIVGSAFMDALDLFPAAGIRFISVQHEQNSAHMADGYARISGTHGVAIGQNGPGVTNSVTAIAAAYWAHSPVVMITPESASLTYGHGGFQEADTLNIFESVVKAQCHVNNPARMAEMTERAFNLALSENGPTQLNIPRDYFYGTNDFKIHGPKKLGAHDLGAGGEASLDAAFDALKNAKNPVILSGGGVVLSEGVHDVVALAEYLGVGVATTYLHNDAMLGSHPLSLGPIGYLGSKGAMNCIADSDCILAIGSRLNPFGTLPQYNMEYWPEDATLIQVDKDPRRLGLTKQADIEVCGDARAFAKEMLKRARASDVGCLRDKDARVNNVQQFISNWKTERDVMTDTMDPHHKHGDGVIKPRMAIRELTNTIKNGPYSNAVIATDIGNSCSVAHGYMDFDHPRHFLAPMTFGNCGYSSPAVMGAKVARPDLPCVAFSGEGAWGMQLMDTVTCIREDIPITVCVFNNGQWGAEKKNQVLWFGDRYVGTDLENPSFKDIAVAMGANGITCTHIDEVGPAMQQALKSQMEDGKTTIIELITTRELGDPFRRDAMKLPQRKLKKYQHTSLESESPTGQPTNTRDEPADREYASANQLNRE
jgi:sulfoacetaldehyde acetyltransferase